MLSYFELTVKDKMLTDSIKLLLSLVALITAITIHETTHGLVANFLGDQTAKRSGRITLNPLAHIDPFGTVLLPLLLVLAGLPPIGWAKPVPINPNNFRNPRLGSALTAIAGPASNFMQAVIGAILFKTVGHLNIYFAYFLGALIGINLVLMVFNLIPIPPLDGSKFFALFIPFLDDPKFEIYGPIFLFIFIFLFHGIDLLFPLINFIGTRILGVGVF